MFNKKKIASAIAMSAIGTSALTVAPVVTAEGITLEEIIVTARKREEGVQDVPVAMAAFTGDAMEEMGINDVADLQSQVPNISSYPARGSTSTLTAYIRGVGQSDPLWGVDPGVGLYFDDVYIARPQGALLDIFDVERVEVLRGPQGTLYGKNTIGGAIKYVSKKITHEFQGKASVTVGEYEQQDFKGDVQIPLIADTLSMKVAGASLVRREGFGENTNNGEQVSDKEIYSGRIALQWDPSDTFSATFSADYTEDHSAPRGAQIMAPNPVAALYGDAAAGAVSTDRYDVANGFLNKNDAETQGYSLILNAEVSDEVSFKSITAFRKGASHTFIDFDTTPFPITDVWAIYEDDQFTQEMQFTYGGESLDLVAGVYFMTGDAGGLVGNEFFGDGVLTGGAIPNHCVCGTTGGNVKTTSTSAYGQASYNLNDEWALNLGARVTTEEKAVVALNESFGTTDFDVATATAGNFTDSKTFREVSPRIGVDWTVNDDILVYASLSEGFKSGGFNVRANTTAVPESAKPYDPETVRSFELGAKTTLMDGRVTLNAALFANQYKDIQLSVFTSLPDGSFFGDFTNAGEATINGIEIDVKAALTESLVLNASLGLLDTEYDEYMQSGVNIADSEQLTNAPDATFNIGLAYNTYLGEMGELSARLDYAWRDESVLTTETFAGADAAIAADPATYNKGNVYPHIQDAYGVVNGSVSWMLNDNLKVTLLGKNLADEEYLQTGYNFYTTGLKIRSGFYGAPRTVSLGASYTF